MRNALVWPAILLAGCASRPPAFSLAPEAAAAEARREGRPLMVLSVVGELDGRL